MSNAAIAPWSSRSFTASERLASSPSLNCWYQDLLFHPNVAEQSCSKLIIDALVHLACAHNGSLKQSLQPAVVLCKKMREWASGVFHSFWSVTEVRRYGLG